MTSDQPSNPKPFRHWYQYSLRTLMIVVTLFAVACSWFAVKMKQARRQREAVEAILKSGGTVAYDYECDKSGHINPTSGNPPGPEWLRKLVGDDFFTTAIILHPSNITDTELEHLEGLPYLQVLGLRYNKITDAGLGHVKKLTRLHTLDLQSTQVTDAGTIILKGMNKLKWLSLFNTKVTDVGLKNLEDMTQLQDLYLGETNITDAGLVYLRKLTQLQSLGLQYTKITDVGLVHLQGLSQLKWLHLTNTKTTKDGVDDLQKAIPNLYIELKPPTDP